MKKLEVFLQIPATDSAEEARIQVQEEEWDCWIEGGWSQF